jgi:hypothetical protein
MQRISFIGQTSYGDTEVLPTIYYNKLLKNGTEITNDSDSTIQVYDNIKNLTGDVLCLGLGLGFIGNTFQDFTDSFTYVEININDIYLLEPYLEYCGFINGDAYTFEPLKNYDFIVIDIFETLQEQQQNLQTLIDRYTPYLNEGGQIVYPNLN